MREGVSWAFRHGVPTYLEHPMQRLLISFSMLAACHAALAQPWSFTRVVDSDTNIPGTSTLKFDGSTSFQYVSVYGDRVAFRGQSKSGNGLGVYEWKGGIGRTIANKTTIVPRGTKPFGEFEDVNASSRGVTFYGAASDNSGIFYEDGATLGHVADRQDDVPGSSVKFAAIRFAHQTEGTSTAFAGAIDATTGATYGVYRSDDGVLSRVADKTMSPPSRSDLFSLFKTWRLDGNSTYFSADTTTGYSALFKSEGGVLSTFVDNTMSLPDGRFLSNPNGPRPNGDTVLFKASVGTGHDVLTTKSGETIQLLVDDAMDPPGPSTSFNGINQYDYKNGTLVFGANDSTIYTNYGNVLQKVIGPGDVLDGKVVAGAFFYEHGFDGTTAALWVIFAGDSSFHYDRAIYTVTIPAPGTACLALFSALATSSARRRRPHLR